MFFLMSIILSFHINLGAVVYLMHIKYKTHTLFDKSIEGYLKKSSSDPLLILVI